MPRSRSFALIPLACLAVAGLMLPSRAEAGDEAQPQPSNTAARLVAAYPDLLAGTDGNWLLWRDGKTRLPFDDGKGIKPYLAWLEAPDIEDTLQKRYPAGAGPLVPEADSDPGRARNEAFFDRMYGDCRKGEVKGKLRRVVWLPRKAAQRLEITSVNGVAERLDAVSKELDQLPASFDKFLAPAAGTYNCRVVAGTGRVSGHGYGIAIDIAVRESDYWRWAAKGAAKEAGATAPYRNRIPLEIVHIFEKHGFIWGGRWAHFDTMHFEYRPELLPPLAPLPAAAVTGPKPAETPAAGAPPDEGNEPAK
jgi:hypothetical protein